VIKLVCINHSFQIGYFSRRWELLAEEHKDIDVTLFAPQKYEWYKNKEYNYGKSYTITSDDIDKGNFHKRTFRVQNHKRTGWTSPDFRCLLNEIHPDIVYFIGNHRMASLYQVIKIVKKDMPDTKIIAFSMRGPVENLVFSFKGNNILMKLHRRLQFEKQRLLLRYFNNNIDAVFCHYPDAVDCFKKEGYNGPIYMQTQVGVNTEWFHPDEDARKDIREKYNITPDTYVFGSATRFTTDKGIDDIVKALPLDGDWKYIMMGNGSEDDVDRLKSLVKERGLEDKVIMPGMIDWYEISKYWNAIDCAIHVPHTASHWVETFSLSAIQPQATMKPIIGDDSGSVPYQLGFDEMIVPEGDIKALNGKIQWVLNHKTEAIEIGKKMYDRTIRSFSVQSLNELFYRTLVEDVLQGRYDEGKFDMANVSVK